MMGEAGRRGESKAFWRRWRRGQHSEHTMKHFNVGAKAQSSVWMPGFVRAPRPVTEERGVRLRRGGRGGGRGASEG